EPPPKSGSCHPNLDFPRLVHRTGRFVPRSRSAVPVLGAPLLSPQPNPPSNATGSRSQHLLPSNPAGRPHLHRLASHPCLEHERTLTASGQGQLLPNLQAVCT